VAQGYRLPSENGEKCSSDANKGVKKVSPVSAGQTRAEAGSQSPSQPASEPNRTRALRRHEAAAVAVEAYDQTSLRATVNKERIQQRLMALHPMHLALKTTITNRWLQLQMLLRLRTAGCSLASTHVVLHRYRTTLQHWFNVFFLLDEAFHSHSAFSEASMNIETLHLIILVFCSVS